MSQNKIERIKELLAGATRDREQLEARYVELVGLLDLANNDYARDELAQVIYGGANFDDAMRRIMRRKQMFQ